MILWAYTGQWFAAPMVAIESGSMEHNKNPPFGRLGTIDAGDMVLVQKVSSKKDVVTHGGKYGGAEAVNGLKTYGDYGDVVIYHPEGDMAETQIIHRVMCWVDVTKTDGQTFYTIKEFGVYNVTSIPPISEIGLESSITPHWDQSGYLTKGDANPTFDQNPLGGIQNSRQPVRVSWISGKARSEIPWLGTINLFFDDVLHGKTNLKWVHEDSWICLAIVIAILISIPIILDIIDYVKKKKKQVQKNEDSNNR
jgi:signal peptidase